MQSQLIYLVYVSASVYPFSEAELLELLVKARENNAALGVTGMLLYGKGNFIQVLEGEEENVIAVHQKILKDPRHKSIITLMQRNTDRRLFPDWSMGFKNISHVSAENTPGFSDFLTTDMTPEAFQNNPEAAYKLLLTFRKTIH